MLCRTYLHLLIGNKNTLYLELSQWPFWKHQFPFAYWISAIFGQDSTWMVNSFGTPGAAGMVAEITAANRQVVSLELCTTSGGIVLVSISSWVPQSSTVNTKKVQVTPDARGRHLLHLATLTDQGTSSHGRLDFLWHLSIWCHFAD